MQTLDGSDRATEPELRRSAEAAAALWPIAERGISAQATVAAALTRAPEQDLLAHLTAPRRTELAVHGVALAAWIATRHRRSGRGTLIVGVNGGQGSGKSTLSALVAGALAREFDLPTRVLSLDDLYLTRAQRRRLAEEVHPLLSTRGVPGTHDLVLGHAALDALSGAAPWQGFALPRFDKASDDRAPRADADLLDGPVSVVLFEGWCVGATPEAEAALSAPCNRLEAEEDVDGRWRRSVNARLAGDYAALFRRLDALVMLQVPDFDAVGRWREEQELELRRRGRAMTSAEVVRFIQFYERVTRHQLAVLPGRADLVLTLDATHAVTQVRGPASGSGSGSGSGVDPRLERDLSDRR